MEREGCDKKRLLCFVKSTIEAKERTDLMSDKLSNVWIEIQGKHQKILICTAYREFSDLVTPGQMSGTEQRERWKLFMDQAKSASKEGLVLVIGDLNLDLEKFEDRQRKRLRISTPLTHSERKSRVFLPLSSLAMSGKIFSPCSHSEGGDE